MFEAFWFFSQSMINQGILKNNDYEKVPITNKFTIYFFRINGNQCILFEKFFQAHYWGITDYHRKSLIPNLIKAKLYDLFD